MNTDKPVSGAPKEIGITVKEAIENRRSIRKFLAKDIHPDIINELIRAAQLAPSAVNAQPWRFKIITDQPTKQRLAETTFNHHWIAEAPVILVCCGDVANYKEAALSGLQYLSEIGAVNPGAVAITDEIIKSMPMESSVLWINLAMNVAIAIEQIVLRAVDFGLGTCWIGGFFPEKVKEIFRWGDNLFIAAMLPIGYPAEAPQPRKRLSIDDLLL